MGFGSLAVLTRDPYYGQVPKFALEEFLAAKVAVHDRDCPSKNYFDVTESRYAMSYGRPNKFRSSKSVNVLLHGNFLPSVVMAQAILLHVGGARSLAIAVFHTATHE